MMTQIQSTGRILLKIAAVTTVMLSVVQPGIARAQEKQKQEKKDKKDKPKEPRDPGTFFNTDMLFQMTLTTNMRKIRGDKGDQGPWRSATMSYVGEDGKPVVVPIQIKTRGIWRKKNCEFPPVRLNFSREKSKGTVFFGLDKPKLVSYCRDDDTYEQYVLQEYQLYRIYRMLTPNSYRARLVEMTYADSASGKVEAKRAAILLEEPGLLAERVGTSFFKEKGAGPEYMEPHHGALVGVFEYFIGNTDFSIFALHNIALLAQPDGNVIPVPFDFDFSGAVNARYATTDPSLSINRVRQRLFRGYCAPKEEYTKVFDLFREKKDSIYALYQSPVGKMMRKDYVEETLKYYNDFYKTINDPRDAKSEIVESCITGR
jgi:hypothetical protein